MNKFLYLISEEKIGGLFDFDGTLPLLALQFVLLTIILKFVLYSPVLDILDKRRNFVSTAVNKVSQNLVKADKSILSCLEILTETKALIKDNITVRIQAIDNSFLLIGQDFYKQYSKNEESISEIFTLARWEALEYFLNFSTSLTFQAINFFTIRGEVWNPSLIDLEKNYFHQVYVKNLEEGANNGSNNDTISGI